MFENWVILLVFILLFKIILLIVSFWEYFVGGLGVIMWLVFMWGNFSMVFKDGIVVGDWVGFILLRRFFSEGFVGLVVVFDWVLEKVKIREISIFFLVLLICL